MENTPFLEVQKNPDTQEGKDWDVFTEPFKYHPPLACADFTVMKS